MRGNRTAGEDRDLTRRRDRALDDLLVHLAVRGERVLDLGCGSGELLRRLKDEKGVRERGVEIDGRMAAEALSRGLAVVEGDLEESLRSVAPRSFDLVILNEVLPLVKDPLGLIDDSLRAGRRAAVTFPNFAAWRVRWQLGLRGRLPVTAALPFQWHDTPHVRYFTVADFHAACRLRRWRILQERFVSLNGEGPPAAVGWWPNLRASLALFVLAAPAAGFENRGPIG